MRNAWRYCVAQHGGGMDRITTAQAAERAGVSRWAIHRAKKSGDLTPIRANDGRFLFDPAEVDRWAAERARTVAQPSRNTSPHGADANAAQPGAHAEIEAMRARLVEVEARAVEAERRADVAEALAAERAERIEDLRAVIAAPPRWWPFGR